MKPFCILLSVLLSAGIYAAAQGAMPAAAAGAHAGEKDEKSDPAPAHARKASIEQVTEWYDAVGTIRPRTESRLSAQLTAQIVDIRVRPGDRVAKGDLLIVLDDLRLLSRLDQAKQGLKAAQAAKKQARQGVIAAEAAFKQAESEFQRVEKYYRSQAATRKDLEQAESAYRQARARLQQAKEALAGSDVGIRHAEELVRESTIALGYTKIRAPEAAEVLERLAEPGDMALPGKPLLALRTTGSLRIEAFVREGLIQKVAAGVSMPVTLTTLEQTVDATIEEIVPYADPRTRTFLVKAALPEMEGLFPGMFGKLRIPVRQYPAVMIPAAAVRNVGQLELVRVREAGQWRSIYIKTGATYGDKVEVLSGLSGNETIGWGE